jgi:hypothetical protein
MDFSLIQQNALLLAGTVALPSPIPAVGQVSIVITPATGDSEFYIKIVQVVSDKRIITRFVRLADIRAIRAASAGESRYDPENWPIIKAKELQDHVDKKVDELSKKKGGPGAAVEIKLFDAAIVYVPEGAPVLHRDEVGVTAAVSAEDVGFSAPHGPGCERELGCRREHPLRC